MFDLKKDAFRALVYVDENETRLVSRNGNVFKSFPHLTAAIHTQMDCKAMLGGEIVCRNENGCPKLYDLLRRQVQDSCYPLVLLRSDGRDVRSLPLIERKRLLHSIVSEQSSVILYADYIERGGMEFYQLNCEHDLEGIVAKLAVWE